MEVVTPSIITQPKQVVAPDLLAELEAQVHEVGQVIVHCIHQAQEPTYIRIWPSTFLYDHHSDHSSELVHAENITFFPVWQEVQPGKSHFTLVFSGLPQSCAVFDLVEHCGQAPGAFRVNSITRNQSDVYYVEI